MQLGEVKYRPKFRLQEAATGGSFEKDHDPPPPPFARWAPPPPPGDPPPQPRQWPSGWRRRFFANGDGGPARS